LAKLCKTLLTLLPLQKDEKDSLADSVRGDVIQQLLPLVDNFELARTQVCPALLSWTHLSCSQLI
jgi:hypothetical protein